MKKQNIKGDLLKMLPDANGIDAGKLMTVSEYAKSIGKTPARVYQLIQSKDGSITAYRIGQSVLVAKNEVATA